MSPNIDSEWEPVACHRELTSVCCDPDGWDGGAVEETSKRDICIHVADTLLWTAETSTAL